MLDEVRIVGVGSTPFRRAPDASVGTLAKEATAVALRDAGLAPADVGMVFFANAVSGLLDGQEMIRGQVALRETGLLGRPVVNVENACASGSTAFQTACLAIASGEVDVALVVGSEKLVHAEKRRSLAAIGTGVDVSRPLHAFGAGLAGRGGGLEAPDSVSRVHSIFVDIYAAKARDFMERSGATAEDLATVVVKNRRHGSLNPVAQFRDPVTVDEVLASRLVVSPLTVMMCSPVSDGAAALVVASARVAQRLDIIPVTVRSAAFVSGSDEGDRPSAVVRAARRAFEAAGAGPDDLDLIELHDATAPAELMTYEELGLCSSQSATELLESGATSLGGRIPVNPSGGLISKGHPIGATGCAQLVELTEQLRRRCGPRQVEGAKLALAQNSGGFLASDVAVAAITILST